MSLLSIILFHHKDFSCQKCLVLNEKAEKKINVHELHTVHSLSTVFDMCNS